MHLIQVPDKKFSSYNEKVESRSFRAGKYGVAVDVWREGVHLWRSYDLNTSETLDSWYARNIPEMTHPDYSNSPFGVAGSIGGLDRFPIPTRGAMSEALSFPSILQIISATAAIAHMPHRATDRTPSHNSVRQRMHQSVTGWLVVNSIYQADKVVIRAVIGLAGPTEPPSALYTCDQRKKDGTNDVMARAEILGPDIDMMSGSGRIPISAKAKSAFECTGRQGLVKKSDAGKYLIELTGVDFDLEIRKSQVYPGKVLDNSGFDTADRLK